MKKIWIKKELYFEKYEFLNFYTIFSDFYLIFLRILLVKIVKKGGRLTAELTWRAGPGGSDVASEPTWRAGPPRRYDVALRPRGRTRVARA